MQQRSGQSQLDRRPGTERRWLDRNRVSQARGIYAEVVRGDIEVSGRVSGKVPFVEIQNSTGRGETETRPQEGVLLSWSRPGARGEYHRRILQRHGMIIGGIELD